MGLGELMVYWSLLMTFSGAQYFIHSKNIRFTTPIMFVIFVLIVLLYCMPLDHVIRNFLKLILLSLFLLPFLFGIKRRFTGLRVILPIGAFMNILVMTVNQGKMPVSHTLTERLGWYAEETETHSITGPNTKLIFLTDCIYLPIIAKDSIVSLGDILLGLGLVIHALQIAAFEHHTRKTAPLKITDA